MGVGGFMCCQFRQLQIAHSKINKFFNVRQNMGITQKNMKQIDNLNDRPKDRQTNRSTEVAWVGGQHETDMKRHIKGCVVVCVTRPCDTRRNVDRCNGVEYDNNKQ